MQTTLEAVRENFIYTPDREQFQLRDHWTSHADEIGKPWKDDCDGFAITCAELLLKAGYAKDRVSLILCKTETGGGHLVCGVIDNGDTFILDNRQRRVWSWSLIKYTWVSQMKLSEPGTWRAIEND